jgi:hypothetical protein
MPIDIATLYDILRDVAVRRQQPFHYSDLSNEYQRRTGEWHEPHGTWDEPLGQINLLAYRHNPRLPPLSAVVTLKPEVPGDQSEPGGLFWGSSPGVPAKPRNRDDRLLRWADILREVHEANWPPTLPFVP